MMVKRNNSVFDEVETLFNSLFYNLPVEVKPPLDKKIIYNNDCTIEETILQIALAGYGEEDIKVWIEGREIHIEGSNIDNEEVLDKFKNKFKWKIPVGEKVSLDDTKVSFNKGLLTIKIPIKIPEKKKVFLMGTGK